MLVDLLLVFHLIWWLIVVGPQFWGSLGEFCLYVLGLLTHFIHQKKKSFKLLSHQFFLFKWQNRLLKSLFLFFFFFIWYLIFNILDLVHITNCFQFGHFSYITNGTWWCMCHNLYQIHMYITSTPFVSCQHFALIMWQKNGYRPNWKCFVI